MVNEMSRVRAIICGVGKIDHIEPDDDIYDAGVSSVRALELLLELEAAFEVSIPDDLFIEARTPRALHNVLVGRQQEQVL